MCCTTCTVHILFGAVLLTGTIITIIAFTTPGWTQLYVKDGQGDRIEDTISFGLISKICPDMDPNDPNANIETRCENAYQRLPATVKVVIVLMGISILGQLVALVWSAIVFPALCCKESLVWPLPIITAFVSMCLLISVIIYCVYVGQDPGPIPRSLAELEAKDKIGYSTWLAILAFVTMAADTIIGALLARSAAVSPL